MKKLIRCINGNKSMIGFALLCITQLSFMKNLLGVDLVVIQSIIGTLTGVSLVHHMKKGDFTAKKD